MKDYINVLEEKEQGNLPAEIRTWVEQMKGKKGVHQRQYRGATYLLVTSGVKPHPGYELQWVKRRQEKQTIEVVVREEKPAPDQLYPQVLNCPYLLFQVKGVTLRIIDAETGELFTGNIKTQ